MTPLNLDVRLDGFDKPIGTLSRNETGALAYQYQDAFLQQANALPLSLSLPLQTAPYNDVLVRPFFDNLLQERNDPLQALMAREGIARDDIASLLLHLGKDCAGAISVLPEGASPTKVPGDFANDYEPLSAENISAIVKSLHNENVFPAGTQDPSPLSGVQNKFALTILPDGHYAFPKIGTGAPTTHIIKVPKRNHSAEAKREDEALELSRIAEIETIHSEIRTFDGIEVLLVERFDRALDDQGRIIRIHQEDFAQALGLPRELKYERYGKEGRRFDAQAIARVLDETAEPAISRSQFIGATFFDLLIGNTDAHAKNHALLYEGSRKPNLSPRYDLLPTRLDPEVTEELPFKIGNAINFDQITLEDINIFLKALGIATASGRKRITQNAIRKLSHDLAKSLVPIQQRGLKNFADLIASNCRKLCDVVGVKVPSEAKDRDAFFARGGGWLTS
jgi:serine/threonine-protein kinase HipA